MILDFKKPPPFHDFLISVDSSSQIEPEQGPVAGCSKLTTTLVNVSLRFETLIL